MESSSELGLLLNQGLKLFSAAKVNYTHLAFQEAPINSRLWTDSRHNCLLSDNDRMALKWKVPGKSKALFILGAQKSGTTYLFNMLMTHPGFILSKCDRRPTLNNFIGYVNPKVTSSFHFHVFVVHIAVCTVCECVYGMKCMCTHVLTVWNCDKCVKCGRYHS